MFDKIILSCNHILSKCFTFADYKCFYFQMWVWYEEHILQNICDTIEVAFSTLLKS